MPPSDAWNTTKSEKRLDDKRQPSDYFNINGPLAPGLCCDGLPPLSLQLDVSPSTKLVSRHSSDLRNLDEICESTIFLSELFLHVGGGKA
jgi:hypothetical protein